MNPIDEYLVFLQVLLQNAVESLGHSAPQFVISAVKFILPLRFAALIWLLSACTLILLSVFTYVVSVRSMRGLKKLMIVLWTCVYAWNLLAAYTLAGGSVPLGFLLFSLFEIIFFAMYLIALFGRSRPPRAYYPPD